MFNSKSSKINRIYKRIDFNIDPIAYKIIRGPNGFISGGALYQFTCIKCGILSGLKHAGDVNRIISKRGAINPFYCTKCYNNSLIPQRNCKYCNKQIKYKRSFKRPNQGKYCDKACYTAWQKTKENKGSNNPNYKGTYKRERESKSVEARRWRDAVFQRDNYTCQICNQRGGRLNAHHIYVWRDFELLRYILSNGITLCKKCHNKTHANENSPLLIEITRGNNQYGPVIKQGNEASFLHG